MHPNSSLGVRDRTGRSLTPKQVWDLGFWFWGWLYGLNNHAISCSGVDKSDETIFQARLHPTSAHEGADRTRPHQLTNNHRYPRNESVPGQLQTLNHCSQQPHVDLGFRVPGFGFQVSDFGSQVSGFRCRVPCFRFRVPGFGFRVSDFVLQVPASVSRFRSAGSGFWVLCLILRGGLGFGSRVSDVSGPGFRRQTGRPCQCP